MSIAERTRAAVRERPFLLAALRAGVVNYTAAARALDLDAGEEAVAAALRRYAEELDERSAPGAGVDVRVTMQGRLGPVDGADDAGEALLTVGDTALASGEGELTGVVARATDGNAGEGEGGGGDGAGARALGAVLARLDAEDVAVEAAGVADGSLVVVVDRRDGPDALRLVESVLA